MESSGIINKHNKPFLTITKTSLGKKRIKFINIYFFIWVNLQTKIITKTDDVTYKNADEGRGLPPGERDFRHAVDGRVEVGRAAKWRKNMGQLKVISVFYNDFI